MGRRKRPRGRVRRAGKRAKADPAYAAYTVGCVLEELVRSVEAACAMLPHHSCELRGVRLGSSRLYSRTALCMTASVGSGLRPNQGLARRLGHM